MGVELEKYRHDVCQAEKHEHDEAGELDCILRTIVRLQRSVGRSALPT